MGTGSAGSFRAASAAVAAAIAVRVCEQGRGIELQFERVDEPVVVGVLVRSEAAPLQNLGRVVDLHVEGAMAELEHALNGKLSHLDERDREALRFVLLRAAKRNAHYHIQDIRQLAIAQ